MTESNYSYNNDNCSIKAIYCTKCSRDINEADFLILRCGHNYHRDCASKYCVKRLGCPECAIRPQQ
jgi:hypothetical protein